MNILLISYYWPPSGGAGVQRWVKLSKYLARAGMKIDVVTVDPAKASYMSLDSRLADDVDNSITVHHTHSFEPLNFYSKLVGKKNVATSGFSNVDTDTWQHRIFSTIRSNLFIPDPRKGWNKYALTKALEIIDEKNIEVVITTSPPHSTQLVGLKIKELWDIFWVADLRDPWTDIYYYEYLNHSSYSRAKDRKLEQSVLEKADKVLTVGKSIAENFKSKLKEGQREKFQIIQNGYDPDDFSKLVKVPNERFTISYTGTLASSYKPEVIFRVLEKLSANHDFVLKLVGSIAPEIVLKLKDFSFDVEFVEPMPHDEIVVVQKNADLLLLVIPDVEGAEQILTGKLFEYLATGNWVLGIGPEEGDAAALLRNCKSGLVFERHMEDAIKDFVSERLAKWSKEIGPQSIESNVRLVSREYQAAQILNMLNSRR